MGRSGFGQVRKGDAGGAVEEKVDTESSEDGSWIGVAGESSLSLSSSSSMAGDRADHGEEEVQSKLKADALGSLESLAESLPIKRGLSSFFSGKSKSFASLREAAALGSTAALAKQENHFNKRRRVLMACKASWQRRANSDAGLYTSNNLGALGEDEQGDDEQRGGGGGDGDGGAGDRFPTPSSLPTGPWRGSPSCPLDSSACWSATCLTCVTCDSAATPVNPQ